MLIIYLFDRCNGCKFITQYKYSNTNETKRPLSPSIGVFDWCCDEDHASYKYLFMFFLSPLSGLEF